MLVEFVSRIKDRGATPLTDKRDLGGSPVGKSQCGYQKNEQKQIFITLSSLGGAKITLFTNYPSLFAPHLTAVD